MKEDGRPVNPRGLASSILITDLIFKAHFILVKLKARTEYFSTPMAHSKEEK